jgi:glucose-1-phosphate adenylyltransferase
MDYSSFVDYHEEKEADLTIALLEVDKKLAHQFGVAEVDPSFRITVFLEKPKNQVKAIPGDPNHILASMGIYIFRTEKLVEILKSAEKDDFGRDIIPSSLETYQVYAFPYRKLNRIEDYIYVTLENGERELRLESCTRDSSYWRDVGTLDAYWNANMDLTGVDPKFNLYGRKWPIHTHQKQSPPAKFVFANERSEGFRVGKALDSVVASGSIVSGIVRNSIIAHDVVVRSWSTVDESVLSDGVEVGRYCKIKKAIIDKDNTLPPYTAIGYNTDEDHERFTVTDRGVVVVPKNYFSST